MSQKSKVAVIGTGGTISSIGRDELDVQNYLSLGRMHDAAGMIATFPTASRFADLIPVAFPPIPSTDMDFPGWAEMLRLIEATEAAHPDVAGFVILHGTATLEETAYALNLTAKTERTIVVTGAQRPSTGLSTDAAANFVDAVRVASDARARGLGVLVVTNNEIHAAREVTKSSTWRLQTFNSPSTASPCVSAPRTDRSAVKTSRHPRVSTFPIAMPDATARPSGRSLLLVQRAL